MDQVLFIKEIVRAEIEKAIFDGRISVERMNKMRPSTVNAQPVSDSAFPSSEVSANPSAHYGAHSDSDSGSDSDSD